MVHHGLAKGGHDIAAENDILLHFRITKVEITILQTGILVCFTGVVDLERQLVITAAAEDPDLFRNDFDIAGCLVRVLRRSFSDDARNLDRRLLIDRFQFFYLIFGLENDLCRTVEITKHNESEIASDLTHIFHPADQRDILSRVGKTKLAAVMCP